jgi:hypothetical protein
VCVVVVINYLKYIHLFNLFFFLFFQIEPCQWCANEVPADMSGENVYDQPSFVPPLVQHQPSPDASSSLSIPANVADGILASKAGDGLASSLISQSSTVPPPQKNHRKSRNTQIALLQRKSTRIKKASTKYS